MDEHLFNIREAAEYLGVSERRLKELVDKNEVPAYKIGGTFLRFKKSQLDALGREAVPAPAHTGLDRLKDFFYFNDFYILSIIIIIAAVVLITS